MKLPKIKNGKKFSEVLREAAEIVSKNNGRRWARYDWFTKNIRGETCYCAEGAILKAAGYRKLREIPEQEAILEAADACFERIPSVTRAIKYDSILQFAKSTFRRKLMRFNDSRTNPYGWQEVRDALLLAAKVAEREEKKAAV